MDTNDLEKEVTRALHEYAERDVPGDIDGWLKVQAKLESRDSEKSNIRASVAQAISASASEPKREWSLVGAGITVSLLLVATLGLVAALSGGGRVDSDTAKATQTPFVPEGMVRHMVFSNTIVYHPSATKQLLPTDYLTHIWVTNGRAHYIGLISMETESSNNAAHKTWIQEDQVYTPDGVQHDIFYKMPYAEGWARMLFTPNSGSIRMRLDDPGTRTVGSDTLNGKRVIQFENNMGSSRVWIEIETERDIQIEFTTQAAGKPSSIITNTVTLMSEELLERRELPEDFFEFKLPEGAKLVEKESPFTSDTPTIVEMQGTLDSTISQATPIPFVPQGKIRHITVEMVVETDPPGDANVPAPSTRTVEVWLTNGRSHLIMREEVSGLSHPTRGEPITPTTWVDEDWIYEYSVFGKTLVRKIAFNSGYLDRYVPSQEVFSNTLKRPNASIVEETVLNGRPVLVIEQKGEAVPATNPTPPDSEHAPGETPSTGFKSIVYSHRMWVDKETYRALKWQYVTRNMSGPENGAVTTTTSNIIEDELLERSALPDDFFTVKLPEGAEIIEETYP